MQKNKTDGISFSFSQSFSYCYRGPNEPAVVLWQKSSGCSELSWERNSSRGLGGMEGRVSGRKWACFRISRPSHNSVPFRQNGSVPQREATGGAGRREPCVLAIRAQRGCCDLSPQGGRRQGGDSGGDWKGRSRVGGTKWE